MSHAMPSVPTPSLAASAFALVLAMFTASASRGQCPTDCQPGCSTLCVVTTQAELQQAVDCYEASAPAHNYCSHIRIPDNTTLAVSSTIWLNGNHDGLHIEIIGTIEFTDSAPLNCLFDVNGTAGLTFDGGGTITATDDPWVETGHATARTFRFHDGASNLTIENLTVTRMTDFVKVEAGGASDLTIRDAYAERLGQYGIWIDNRTIAHIENCHIVGALDQHGFRIYGDDVTILNCSAYDVRGGSIWLVEGDGFLVDRFAGEQWLRFGCPAGDACGNQPSHDAGEPEDPPQSIEDCWQKCSEAVPGGGQAWADCFEACVEAVEQMQSGGGP